ncbi:MAG TPA: menaquinone reductase multiheme cytochrome c subunit QrcA [Bryobacteraceae bacterium]|nr:menaquinone reductase multiheme cytochrome c subunit QrcA [Bryobacteraceae bacterium]
MSRSSMTFGFGFLTALAVGWFAFPYVLYVQRAQPLEFRHKTHADKSGVTECKDCHAFLEDGEFAGIPKTETCTACHADRIGTSRPEARLVDSYIKKGQEPAWLVYSRQPANVWFSHAIHTRRAGLKCAECHGAYGESDEVRTYEVNRISGYSRDIEGQSILRLRSAAPNGMKMSDCEDCHRKRSIEVGCLGCHQ